LASNIRPEGITVGAARSVFVPDAIWPVAAPPSSVRASAQFHIGSIVVDGQKQLTPASPPRAKLSGRIVRVEPRDEDPRAVWAHRMAIEFVEPDATLQSAFQPAATPPSAPRSG